MEIKKHSRQHTLAIFQDFIVPKSQNAETVQFKHPRAHLIVVHAIRMLASVEFDDKHRFETDEIDDKTEHRKLAPELASRQLSSTQAIP